MFKRTTILFAALLLTAACQSKSSADDTSSTAAGNTAQEIRPSGDASKAEERADAGSHDDSKKDAEKASDIDDPQRKEDLRDDEAVPVESQDILAREVDSRHAAVQHVLISWSELAKVYERRGGQDPRGAARSKLEADKLALSILRQAQSGENFTALMRKYSEDPGSAKSGQSYPVTPEASLVEPFKKLSLRLKVDESGVVQSTFGYHIIHRIK